MGRIPSFLAAAIVGITIAVSAVRAEAQTSAMSFSSVALNVADLARAERFYSEVFGLVRTFQYPPQGDPIEIGLGRPDQQGGMGLLLAHFNDDPLPDGKSAYGRIIINSTDARALAERAVAAGAKMLRDVGQPGEPVILFLSDPDGYEFELYQASPGGE
ncbi:MAG: VOC family protein [Vicinamibacterales bacterium]|jgi:catechol 2,3-dioxygenase-like lactoylglutathione lyase family enzyme|nr:VOC family protein [Vicinamibacterales bacterium]